MFGLGPDNPRNIRSNLCRPARNTSKPRALRNGLERLVSECVDMLKRVNLVIVGEAMNTGDP